MFNPDCLAQFQFTKIYHLSKQFGDQGMVVQTLNVYQPWGCECRWISVSSQSSWTTLYVPGQSELQRETVVR